MHSPSITSSVYNRRTVQLTLVESVCLQQTYSAADPSRKRVWTLVQDTARINAGRTPHAFFAKRAAQADTGAARVRLVTELTEPPMPPIHITQVSD